MTNYCQKIAPHCKKFNLNKFFMLTGSDTSNDLSLIFKEMFIGGNFFLKIFSYFSKSVFCSDFHSPGATVCREKSGLQPPPPPQLNICFTLDSNSVAEQRKCVKLFTSADCLKGKCHEKSMEVFLYPKQWFANGFCIFKGKVSREKYGGFLHPKHWFAN